MSEIQGVISSTATASAAFYVITQNALNHFALCISLKTSENESQVSSMTQMTVWCVMVLNSLRINQYFGDPLPLSSCANMDF